MSKAKKIENGYIYKTKALKKYHLIKSDIEDLEFIKSIGAYGGPTLLYKLEDIIDLFYNKYGDDGTNIEIQIEKITQEKLIKTNEKLLKSKFC